MMISQLIDRLSSLETIVSQMQTENAKLKNELRLDRHRRYMSELTTIMQHERERMLEEKQNILIQSRKYQTYAKSSPSKSSPSYENGTIIISKDADGDMMVSVQYNVNGSIKIFKHMTINGKVVQHGDFDNDGKMYYGWKIEGDEIEQGGFVHEKLECEIGIKMDSFCIEKGRFVNGELQNGVMLNIFDEFCNCLKGDFVDGKLKNGIETYQCDIRAVHDGKDYNGIDGIKYLDEYATYDEESEE